LNAVGISARETLAILFKGIQWTRIHTTVFMKLKVHFAIKTVRLVFTRITVFPTWLTLPFGIFKSLLRTSRNTLLIKQCKRFITFITLLVIGTLKAVFYTVLTLGAL
jgi:hypothetical protein